MDNSYNILWVSAHFFLCKSAPPFSLTGHAPSRAQRNFIFVSSSPSLSVTRPNPSIERTRTGMALQALI